MWQVFKGAHHGFNNEWKPKYFPNSWTFKNCGFITTDDDGHENYKNLSTRMGWKKLIKIVVKDCAKKGVTIGGSKELSKKTLDYTIQFFRENL